LVFQLRQACTFPFLSFPCFVCSPNLRFFLAAICGQPPARNHLVFSSFLHNVTVQLLPQVLIAQKFSEPSRCPSPCTEFVSIGSCYLFQIPPLSQCTPYLERSFRFPPFCLYRSFPRSETLRFHDVIPIGFTCPGSLRIVCSLVYPGFPFLRAALGAHVFSSFCDRRSASTGSERAVCPPPLNRVADVLYALWPAHLSRLPTATAICGGYAVDVALVFPFHIASPRYLQPMNIRPCPPPRAERNKKPLTTSVVLALALNSPIFILPRFLPPSMKPASQSYPWSLHLPI